MDAHHGKHLLIDAGATNQDALLDLNAGKLCLTEIANRIGMTVVMPATGVQFPHLAAKETALAMDVTVDAELNQENGYSAFVLLAESHISIHTFPEASFLTFDCYSCTDFDEEVALEVLEEFFGVIDGNVQVVRRNLRLLERLLANADDTTEIETELPES